MALSETSIVNQALALVGAQRINNIDTDSSNEARNARTQFDQTRDALLRSYEWPFAIKRVALSEDTSTPDFEWEHQFHLPSDFLRLKTNYTTSETSALDDRFEIEGSLLLTNDSETEIKYVSRITDVSKFDPLFVECLVLQLAVKFINPLAGTGTLNLRQSLLGELSMTMSRARVISAQETNVSGRNDWNLARLE